MLCISNNSIKHQSFVYTQLNDQTVLFQTNQFSISHLFGLILKCQTVLFDVYIGPYQELPLWGQSGHGSNGNEGVLCIPQSCSITWASALDCLVSYLGHSFGGGGCLTPVNRCSRCMLQPQPTGLVDLGVIAKKNGVSTLCRAPEVKHHYWMQFSIITRTLSNKGLVWFGLLGFMAYQLL